MSLKSHQPKKTFTALWTPMRLLSRVRFLVGHKMRRCLERYAADVTQIQLLSSMGFLMDSEVWIGSKPLLTQRTLVKHFSRVNSHMALEGAWARNVFEQRLQANGFSPVCTLTCILSFDVDIKHMEQWVHWWGFSCECHIWCALRLPRLLKELWGYPGYWKNFEVTQLNEFPLAESASKALFSLVYSPMDE